MRFHSVFILLGARRKPKSADAKKKAIQGSRKKKKDVDISSDEEEDKEEEAEEEEEVEEDIESDDDDEEDERSKFVKSAPTNQKGRGKKATTVKESRTASRESSAVRKAPASKSKVVKPPAKVSNNTSLMYASYALSRTIEPFYFIISYYTLLYFIILCVFFYLCEINCGILSFKLCIYFYGT